MRLVQNDGKAVAAWVAQRIPFVGVRGFGQCSAIGVVDKNGKAVCGVVYHDWQPQFGTMAFSIAADSPRWAQRSIIAQLFAYPFVQVQVNKLWTATPSSNEAALRLCKGVGMTREAVLAHHFGKDHAIINRMMRKDFMRLYGEKIGQALTTSAA